MLEASLVGRSENLNSRRQTIIYSTKHCKIMLKTAMSAKALRQAGAIGGRLPRKNNRFIVKTLVIMKLTAILLTSAFLNVSARGISQNITFSGQNVPLETVLSAVEKQTGFLFMYISDVLKCSKPVTIKAEKASLDYFLEEIFKNQPLQYDILGQNIFISPKTANGPNGSRPQFFRTDDWRDTLTTVTGKIVNEDGAAIDGATIQNTITKAYTKSGRDGSFSIKAGLNTTLIVSHISYKSREIQVINPDKFLTIVMQFNTSVIDEVIVGANIMAVKRREDATTTTVLKDKDLEKIPGNSLASVFGGYVPGVYIDQDNEQGTLKGLGGEGLTIRGTNSFFSNTAAKVYVDGIEMAKGADYLGLIDKNSIEKIEVVKGPNAATLYGSDAGGGLILITTKKAKPQSTNITLSSGIGSIKSKWMPENAFQQKHQFMVSQGFDDFSYIIGGNLFREGATIPEGGNKGQGVYGNVTIKPVKKLSILLNARYSYDYGKSGRTPVFDNMADSALKERLKESAFRLFDSSYKARTGSIIDVGGTIQFKPFSWWEHNLVLGYSTNKLNWIPLYGDMSENYFLSHRLGENQTLSRRPTIRYSNNITVGSAEKISLKLLSGFEVSNIKETSFSHTLAPADSIGQRMVSNSKYEVPEVKNSGIFTQAIIGLKDKYFLTGAVRFEKTNVFKKINTSPRIGITANFETEHTYFKPRFSYGIGISLPPYDALNPPPSEDGYEYLSNPDIKPQQQKGYDLGLEIYSKSNRYSVELSYFDNKVINSFYYLSWVAADSMTWLNKWENIGLINNRGMELTATYNANSFQFKASYSLVNSKVGKDITVGPPPFDQKFKKGDKFIGVIQHTVTGAVSYSTRKLFSDKDHLSLSLAGLYSAGGSAVDLWKYYIDIALYTDPLQPFPVPTYIPISGMFNADFNLDYSFNNNWKLYLQSKNIFNSYKSQYGQFTSRNGRNILAGVQWNFSR